MPEGGESPPPERQSGKQIHEPPASGQGVQNVDSKAKKGEMEDQLKVCTCSTRCFLRVVI